MWERIEQGPVILEALRARADEEPIWDALRHAFRALSAQAEPQRGLMIARLVAASPGLRAAHLEKHLRWQEQPAPELERRLGDSDDRPACAARTIYRTAGNCRCSTSGTGAGNRCPGCSASTPFR